MSLMRIALVLAVALFVALGLGFIVFHLTSPKPAVQVAAAAPAKPAVQVLTAKRDLSIGTRLTEADLQWRSWPQDALNPAFITDGSAPVTALPATAGAADQAKAKAAKVVKAAEVTFAGGGSAMQSMVGAIVREPILSGEPILERKVVRNGQGGYMSVVLEQGMRAVSVPVTVESGAGGFILPNDRVDVMLTRKVNRPGAQGGDQVAVSNLILRNVRVLAIDQKTTPDKDSQAIVGATATLEVSRSDVSALTRARAQGDLALALRSYADIGGPSGVADPSQGEVTSIKVYRAGHVTEVVDQ